MREVANRMRQKAQFQQVKESVRGMRLGRVSHIITPDPYKDYPYQPESMTEWKEEHGLSKIEELLLERNREHFRQAGRTPFTKDMME